MSMPPDASAPLRALARYTPDSDRWRRRVSALAAIGGPLALYAAFAIASGVKSGIVYDLLILLFATFTLILPAIAVATMFAPDSGLMRTDPSHRENPLETLKRRYAAGEIDHAEFDQRIEDLIGVPEDALDRRKRDSSSEQRVGEEELEPAGK